MFLTPHNSDIQFLKNMSPYQTYTADITTTQI